ncbi:MAG: response regulator [Melioribacteraceae bacterium]|nr:response regulator [Melioribacteraceae bacterium]
MLKRIVIVEDDPGDQKLLKLSLKKMCPNAQLLFFYDGEKAIEFFQNDDLAVNTDLVILDLNLPKKSGLDVLKKIEKLELYEKIKIVIFSTSFMESFTQREIIEMADGYYTKPIGLAAFNDVIKRIISENFPDVVFQNN